MPKGKCMPSGWNRDGLGPLLLIAMLLILPSALVAQTYQLSAVVVNAGGDISSAGYKCGIALAQTGASDVLTSGAYQASIGFWHTAYGDSTTGVANPNGSCSLPLPFELRGVAPNPFEHYTAISYSLPTAGRVELDVVDAMGRVLTSLVNDRQESGEYSVTWDVSHVPAGQLPKGVYFCRLRAGNQVAVRKMVKLE